MFIARHGNYDHATQRINERGFEEACFQANVINQFTRNARNFEATDFSGFLKNSTAVISSPEPRAMETANILAGNTGIGRFSVENWLGLSSDGDKIFQEGLPQILSKKDCDSLVFVTHEPVILSFAFASEIMDFIYAATQGFSTGDLFYINLEKNIFHSIIYNSVASPLLEMDSEYERTGSANRVAL